MEARQKYHLFSKYLLPKEVQEDILDQVRGSFLTWVGDKDDVEKTSPSSGMFKYLLDCSELTLNNTNYLINKLNLYVEIVREADLSARLNSTIPAITRMYPCEPSIKKYSDPPRSKK